MSKCREDMDAIIADLRKDAISASNANTLTGDMCAANFSYYADRIEAARTSSRGEAVAYRYDYYEDHHEQFDFSPTPFLDSWVKIKNAKVTPLYDHTAPCVVAGEVDAGEVDAEKFIDALDDACMNFSKSASGVRGLAVSWYGYTRDDRINVVKTALTAAIGRGKE